MTQGEFLTAHAARNSSAGYTTEAQLALFRANGLDEAQANALLHARRLVPEAWCRTFRQPTGASWTASSIAIGGRSWR